MSRNTRRRRQTHTNMTSPQISTTTDRINEAKEAVNSPDLFKNPPEYIQAVWQELRQAYEASASESHDCQPFPLWALDQLKPNHIENVIRLGYPEHIGALILYAPSARQFFEAEPWRFVLFFNLIEQGRARALNDIIKNREPFAFKRLYKEVRHYRFSRVQGRTNGRSDFVPADFKACCNENTSIVDDSDAEYVECSGDEEEDDHSEAENIAWSSSENPDLDHEIDCIVAHDAHTSRDQGFEETDCLGGNSNCLNIPPSHTTIQGDAEDPDEANAADVMANLVDKEAGRRDTSPNQRLPPNFHPDNSGSSLSLQEQFIQAVRDGPTRLVELEELIANGEDAENNMKILKEKISADAKQLLQVLQSEPSDQIAHSETIVSKMVQLCSDTVIQDGKRKLEEEKKINIDRKKVKLVAEINPPSTQYIAQLSTDIQRHEAASEDTPQ